jgi:hypothetical protein
MIIALIGIVAVSTFAGYCFGYSGGWISCYRAFTDRKVPTGDDDVFTVTE